MTVFPRSEPSKVKVKGVTEKSGMPASKRIEFEVDTNKAGKDDINVEVKNPKGRLIPAQLKQIANDKYTVAFVPDDCGTYSVRIKYGDKDIEGSPFKLEAFAVGEAKKCKIVEKVPKIQPSGSKSQITVDAREAGDGAVTCKITSKTGQ